MGVVLTQQTSGPVERIKGGQMSSNRSLQQFGSSGAIFNGGGNIAVFLSNAGEAAGSAGMSTAAVAGSQTLATYTLPANAFDKAARGLNIQAWGKFANNVNNKQVWLRFGSGEIVSTGVVASSGAWYVSMSVFKSGPSQQVVSTEQIVSQVHGGTTSLTGTESDTSPIVISLIATAPTAGSDVVANAMSVSANN